MILIKSVFDTQKREEAQGNTKNKQKIILVLEKNQFCFVVQLVSITL